MSFNNAVVCALALVVTAGLACGLAPAQSDTLPPIDLSVLLDRMNENGSTVRSGRLLARTESSYFRDGQKTRAETWETELWFDGVRVRVEIRASSPASESEEIWILFDGERVLRTYPPDFVPTLAAVPRELSELARHLSFGYINTLITWPLEPIVGHSEPVGDDLRGWSQEPPQLGGEDQVGALACQLIVIPPVNAGGSSQLTRRLWPAPGKGYAVAKYEEEIAVPSPDEVSRMRTVDVAEEWMQPIEGLCIPRVATRSKWIQYRDTGNDVLIHKKCTKVLSAAFNIPIPDDVFKLELPDTVKLVPWE